jgi:hypothetical protein
VRRLALALALVPCGCLAEYVLPGDATGDVQSTSGDGEPSGGAPGEPTSGDMSGDMSGDVSGGGDTEGAKLCDPGLLRCGDACVDPGSDEAHCGGCEGSCKDDERCIVGECRDVVVLECDSCPCADQCPQKDQGVLAATSGESAGGESDSASGDTAESAGDESGGKDPQQYLCCVVEASSQVWCVIGDMEDPLVCP